jgi:hypothetical protein
MTKADLLDILRDFHDDDVIVIEVHDTTLHEDLYDFHVDSIDDCMGLAADRTEIRLCPTPFGPRVEDEPSTSNPVK